MIFESHVLVLLVVGIIEIIVLFLWWQKRITASSVLGLSSALYLFAVIIIKFPHSRRVFGICMASKKPTSRICRSDYFSCFD